MYFLFRAEIPQFALSFRDYIRLTYSQELHLQETHDGVQVFVAESAVHFQEILRERDVFLRDPFNARYEQASWHNGDTRSQVFTDKKCGQKSDRFSAAGFLSANGKFTLFITALCILIYLLDVLRLAPVYQWAGYPEYTGEHAELWRYVSHTLVHLSFWHIVFNLTWWWIFGNAIEKQCGSAKLVMIYLIAGAGSGIVQNFFSGPHFFGLSGVVYAVLAYVFCADYFSRKNRFNLPQGFAAMLIVGILLGFAGPLWGVEMGNAAHISGLILGGLIALRDCRIKK